MNEKESARISTLTTGAIKTASESTVKSMIAMVDAAETKISDLQEMVNVAAEKTREMREFVEKYADNFTRATGVLATNVGSHVTACQAVIDMCQEHQLNILNIDSAAAVNGDGSPNHDRLIEDIQKLHEVKPQSRGRDNGEKQ